MKFGNSDVKIVQHVERRRVTAQNAAPKTAVDSQPRFIRQTHIQRPELIRGRANTSSTSGEKKAPARFIVAALAIAGAGIFAWFALLFPVENYKPAPEADSRVYSEMMNFVSGLNSAAPSAVSDMPLSVGETFNWQNYTVRKGDSVSKIASEHSLSIDAVIASNSLKNVRNLQAGDIIRIPNMDGIPYTVVRGDSYQKIASYFGVPLEAILDANDVQDESITIGATLFIPGAKMKSEDLKLAMGELFIYPVNGRLSSGFGWRKDPFNGGERRFHAGLDLQANMGTLVKAAMDGKVTSVGFNAVFGRYLIITHQAGYQTMYAHLNSASVLEGQKVKQGEKIGEVGNTGRSTGAHLHFAVYKNGRAINPLEHLKF
jgi:murein DD-endopeptidase MepM/ murein hydrolase activator NlpD